MNRRSPLLALAIATLAVFATACPPTTGGGGTTTTTTTTPATSTTSEPTTSTTTTSSTTSSTTTSTTTTSTTTTTPLPGTILWYSNPKDLGQTDTVGAVFSEVCPGNGSEYLVWGSSVYTSDSSICTAAVFEGRITYAGGPVTYRIEPGQSFYPGSTANGVTTRQYDIPWPRSFSFVNA